MQAGCKLRFTRCPKADKVAPLPASMTKGASMAIKPQLHPRNQHKDGYDFDRLLAQTPDLARFVIQNPMGQMTIDFQDAQAVRMLNRALLRAHYRIDFWDIPADYLCPPIPGRADYIHYLADLLAQDRHQTIPQGRQVKVLDIGTGASLVYPLLGQREYGWHFTGVDIDPLALKSAQQICLFNQLKITLRQQMRPENIFQNIIAPQDFFHLTMCNPPFHASLEKAGKGTARKWANLGKAKQSALNFGGQNAELWCLGGEIKFIATMVAQSAPFAHQCLWFTSLVSKKDNLKPLHRILQTAQVKDVKVVDMAQGQKTSRFIAWSYFDTAERSKILADLGQQPAPQG